MINIAFDAKRVFHNHTGLGNYSRTLINNLVQMYPENNYLLATPSLTDHPYALPYLEPPFQHLLPGSKTPGSWWRSISMARDLAKEKVQIYHGLSNELPNGLKQKNIPQVVSIHDLLFIEFPGDYKWVDRKIYKMKFSAACEKADKIIAISHSTKSQIINHFDVPEEKVSVVYQAINPFFESSSPDVLKTTVRSKWEIKQEFGLFVSAYSPRKNLQGVLKAMKTMKRPPLLVVVGQGYTKPIKQYIAYNKLPVIFTGPISNAELRALYQQCSFFIYPSLGEGFGIPVVEAMMSGAPVITSNISSMPEAAGNAAYLIDPYEPEHIAQAMLEVMEDEFLREDLIHKGHYQATRFTSENCTEPVMKIYQELTGITQLKMAVS
jgi:glycosyltransferase involved in cell wall biosynthesis